MLRVPLAWLLLKNEPARLLIGIGGVMFAVVLMLMQMGFRASLYNSAIMFHSHLKAYLVLVNPRPDQLSGGRRQRDFNRGADLRTGFRTRAVLCVPLRTRNREVFGVAQLLNKQDGSRRRRENASSVLASRLG